MKGKITENTRFIGLVGSISKNNCSQDVMLTKSDLLIPEAFSERMVMSL